VTPLRLLLHQLRYEQLLYWRSPSSAVFTFALPIVMLVIFASINRDTRVQALAGLGYTQYFVPGMVAFSVMSACYTQLGIALCFRRDQGVLKRLRGTPLPAWAFMAATVGSCLVVSAILVVLTTAVGVLFYGVVFPGRWAALGLSLAVGAYCFCALGLAVTTLVRHAHAAPAVVNGLFFPVLFASGVFWPLHPGSLLDRLAGLFPVRPFHQALLGAFLPGGPGTGIEAGALAVLAAWGTAGLVIAARRFRWDPALDRPQARG
jgi:ABC-2 type transport system permease protein